MSTHTAKKNAQMILAIEDQPADAELIRIYLEETAFKHEFLTSDSLAGGLTLLRDREIDIVLLDLSLSDTTGFNTLRQYLKEAAHVPVIVMTGLKNQRVGQEAVNAGAQDYLVKGEFDARRLVNSIQYALARFKQKADVVETANQLSDVQARLREVQRMSLLGDWEMDIVTKSMQWSDEMFRLLEVPAQSFAPSLSDYLKLVHREDVDAVTDFFNQALQQEESGPLEHRVLLDNRLSKQVVLRTRIKFDEKTNKILLLGSVQDISHRNVPLEAPPQQAAGDKQQVPEHHVLQQFSTNIRTPLQRTIEFLTLLDGTPLDQQQQQYMLRLKASLEDLSFSLNNLINISLLSNDNLLEYQEKFNPVPLLESMRNLLAFRASQHNLQTDFFIDPRLDLPAIANVDMICHLLASLLELALLNSPSGSFIFWRFEFGETADIPGQLQLHFTYQGSLPNWPAPEEITTNKDALSALSQATERQARERLFAITITRILQHLDASTESHQHADHASIRLSIPLQLHEQPAELVPQEPQQAVGLLLVEDHPMHQIATKQLLSNWSKKITVHLASNGEEALKKVEDTTYDLILLDLQMPVMDGLTAAAKIREDSQVPIIALTTNASKQEEKKCQDLGINDYLAKPFQPEDLFHKVMQQLHRAASES